MKTFSYIFYFIFSLSLIRWTFCLDAKASVGQVYGFGSQAAGLAGAGVAGGLNPFSAYQNPAVLAAKDLEFPNRTWTVGWSSIYMHPSFIGISGVVIQNQYASDLGPGGLRYGGVDTNYPDTFGQALGLRAKVIEDAWGLSLGFVGYLPIDRVAYLDTGETYQPEYMLYRTRTNRPQFEFALGVEPIKNFYFGAGSHMTFSVTSKASAFLATSNSKTSQMRVTSSMKPKLTPYFGFLWREPLLEATSVALVLRLPAKTSQFMTIESSAEALAGAAAPDFLFNSESTLAYDPLSFESGTSFVLFPATRTYLQVDYQIWENYPMPAPDIKNQGSSLMLREGNPPRYRFKNIFIPHVGQEFNLGDRFQFRGGYAYRPSILKGVSEGAGNYLDPNQHIATLGGTIRTKNLLGFGVAGDVSVHVAYHDLVKQKINKLSGNEVDNPGDSKIGSPGYDAGGKVYGGGLTLSLYF